MNKRSIRWISLFLSMAVMIGSLTYIAAGINAETVVTDNGYLISATGSSYSGVLPDSDDIISTDEDLMKGTDGKVWTYTAVLDDDNNLVTPNGSENTPDIYLDLVPDRQSASVGEKLSVVVTMENTTANDVKLDAEENKEVSDAVNVESISFSVAYDATHLTFDKGQSNINGVEFSATGTGAGAAVQVSYAAKTGFPELTAHEMPCFELVFTAAAPTSADTSVSIESGAVVAPSTLTVGTCQPEEFSIYAANGNTALKALDVQLKEGSASTSLILNPEFDPQTDAYFITVPYDTLKADLEIKAETAATGATTSVIWESSEELAAGITSCIVRVTSAGGTATQDYKIIIKKLELHTLADPKTTVTKTITVNEPNSSGMDNYTVNYEINGVNDLLAGGNDYVVFIGAGQTNRIDPDTIRANTANLEDSTLTIIDLSSQSPTKTVYDLSTPEITPISSEAVSAALDPEQYMALNTFTGDNQYLIVAGAADASLTITKQNGYTKILLPDTTSMDDQLAAVDFDNTVAEFVFILDFSGEAAGSSNQVLDSGIVKSIFGYDDGNANTSDLPGYVQQVKNMLSNDSTAKVTLIAIGADMSVESDEDWGSYGIQFEKVSGAGVFTNDYTYNVENSLYQGQTYILPQAGAEFWGHNVESAAASEQHNIWEYSESFTARKIGSSNDLYERAVPADDTLLAAQYADAMTRAAELLAGANNAQLVVITADKTIADAAVAAKITADSGIETTVVPVSGYAANTSDITTATAIYEDLVVDSVAAFNCDPGSNNRTISLVDEINRQVYQLSKVNAYMAVVNASTLDIVNTSNKFAAAAKWYLPSIGEYVLTADYTATRWSVYNVDTETHYYPISNTVKTEINEDNDTLLDDIPTVAPSYDDKYELTVTKAVSEFKDIESVIPEKSEITYVLLYTNTGTETLTEVGITDNQIMLAKSCSVYLLEPGKTEPDDDDTPTAAIKFTAAGNNKGETTVLSLAPGESIYIEYVMVVPEKNDAPVKTIQSSASAAPVYAIENIATGASKEVDLTRVELNVEFEYDRDSGGTVSTSTNSSSSTSGSSTSSSTSASSSTSRSTSTTSSTRFSVVNPYSSTTSSTRVIYKDDVSTGESGVGYILAISLLFGAIGVFGVTVYGITLDKKIQRAAAARNNMR